MKDIVSRFKKEEKTVCLSVVQASPRNRYCSRLQKNPNPNAASILVVLHAAEFCAGQHKSSEVLTKPPGFEIWRREIWVESICLPRGLSQFCSALFFANILLIEVEMPTWELTIVNRGAMVSAEDWLYRPLSGGCVEAMRKGFSENESICFFYVDKIAINICGQ